MPGVDEGSVLTGESDPERIVEALLSAGTRIVALKLGADGCIVADASQMRHVLPFPVARVVDPIGAGDAFAAGFIAGLLEGRGLEDCGRMANAMGACAVTTSGDYEGLLDRAAFDALLDGREAVQR